ncbi:protein-L-isoaspartate O-methyltransferase domain-containing protein 2-like [Uloborus diversus]|uniref:protein-L-isoaspartate O-methyltransferase domain-containing protein 2-like n=1 Tax=Uloborus diversus TaxID=327109 RepID=UPI002409721E|nr:protein-L-isoaspartate O-methyltransferase domain-containing protein 2-like [Uloborus diversus]
MGGAVSAGKNNDELIDHLVEAEFIKTPTVQRIFRSVDRGDYYLPDQKETAYRDIAWRSGNLHLSAPCVYSEVMEALKLKAGHSFLNLGSGSGYLSTMAGLILGPYGTNHGVELYSEIVDYANDKLRSFLRSSSAIDEFDFCEPVFHAGNCLLLDSNCQLYDRVYCGASCPEEYEPYVKNLIKIGGVLILPYNDKLLKITRTSETTWQSVKVLSVSFSPLIIPLSSKDPVTHIKLGDFSPPQLQHLCRSSIRSILRKTIDTEHPNLILKHRKLERKQRRQVRRIVIPIFDESDLSNSQSNSEVEYDSDGPEYTISSRIPSRMSVLLEDFLRRHAEVSSMDTVEQSLRKNEENELKEKAQESDHQTSEKEDDDDSENETDSGKKPGDNNVFISAAHFTFSNKIASTSTDTSSSDVSPAQTSKSKSSKTRKRKHLDSEQTPSTSSGATSKKPKVKRRAATVVWKRIIPRDSDSEEEKEKRAREQEKKNDEENYSNFMIQKIAALPLPVPLLRYLNYRRDTL